jgi:hypothetical protein
MNLDDLVVEQEVDRASQLQRRRGVFSRALQFAQRGIHMERKQQKRGASRAVHHDADHESCS